MKSFNYKALAVAAASACGASAAIAGTVAQPSSPIKFAREAVTNTTTVTVPTLRYTMGVARAASQNFTFIVKVPGAGTTFSGTCPTNFTGTDTSNLSLALKRQSVNECAYDVTVTSNASAVGANIAINGLTVTNHSLGDGTNLTVLLNLTDPGETSRVDNSSDVSVTLGTSTLIATLSATADNHTTADVNYNSGNSPLFGFVSGGNSSSTTVDTTTDTFANFAVLVNSTAYVIADGSTTATATNALANVALNVTGDFSGLITNFANGNSTISYNNGTGVATASVNYTSGVAAFTLANTALNPSGSTAVQVKLTTAGTTSLGTTRTFTVAGKSRGIAGGTFDMTGGSGWWVWKANAIQLQSAFFNNDTASGSLTRFFFQNLGTAANYSAQCYGEPTSFAGGDTSTPVYGSKRNGTLDAGTTAITASDICTFANGSKRGSIVFTINSAAAKIKGVYQQAINGSAATYIPLERPYGSSTAN